MLVSLVFLNLSRVFLHVSVEKCFSQCKKQDVSIFRYFRFSIPVGSFDIFRKACPYPKQKNVLISWVAKAHRGLTLRNTGCLWFLPLPRLDHTLQSNYTLLVWPSTPETKISWKQFLSATWIGRTWQDNASCVQLISFRLSRNDASHHWIYPKGFESRKE